jgi:phi LC3 family holin
MINWKLRIQNRATLWAIISLVVGLVYRILDALHVIPPFTADFVLEIAADILSLLGLLGVIVDPTTDGIGDSVRAMGYDQPWRDGEDYDNL